MNRDTYSLHLDSISGARDWPEDPRDEEEEDEEDYPVADLGPHRFVRINTETDQLFNDLMLTEIEAQNLNAKLAQAGSPFRWRPYGSREGVQAA